MNPKVIPRKGKRGRHRWIVQDMDANNIAVGMSPRDWPTGEDAVRAGEKLLNARTEGLKDQHSRDLAKIKAESDKFYTDNKAKAKGNRISTLKADNQKLERDLSILQGVNTTLMERKARDKRAVIIAYSVVAAGIIIGVAIAAFNSI